MNADQRKFIRVNAIHDGAFRCLDGNVQGALMMTDRSRGGIRATLSQPLEPGKRIECGIHLPDRSLPVFTTGTVMWTRAKPRESTFGFDAGIRWDSSGLLDDPRAAGIAFTPWRLKHIAAFACQRGYYARRFPDTHARLAYFLPSLWLGYMLTGGISSLVFPRWASAYAGSILVWLIIVMFHSLRPGNVRTAGYSAGTRLGILAALCVINLFMQLQYGLFFLCGFLSPREPRQETT